MPYNPDDVTNISIENLPDGRVILEFRVRTTPGDMIDRVEITPGLGRELISFIHNNSHVRAVNKIDEFIRRTGIHVRRRAVRGYAVGHITAPQIFGRVMDRVSRGQVVAIDVGGETDNFGIHLAQVDHPAYGIPTEKIKYPKMKCAGCENDLDEPENLERYMSQKQLDSYIKFCAELNQEPQLFCCHCFDVAKKSSQLMQNYLAMIKSAHSYHLALDTVIRQQRNLAAKTRELNKKEAKLEIKIEKLKHNPIKLLLAQWYSRKFKHTIPKNAVTDEEIIFASTKIPVPYLTMNIPEEYFGKSVLEPKKKFGQVLIRRPELALSYYGFQKLVFAIPREAFTNPKYKIEIPIPFMKNSHGIIYHSYRKRKGWKIF